MEQKISGEKDNLQMLTKIFETNFPEVTVPFDAVTEFSEILVKWIEP